MRTLDFARKSRWSFVLAAFLVAATANVLASPGDIDTAFGNNGVVRVGYGGGSARGVSTSLQADGKVLLGVLVNHGAAVVRRYNADGSLDTAFAEGGTLSHYVSGTTIATARVRALASGKIAVLTGQDTAGRTYLLRFNSDGSIDTTFATNGRFTFSGGSGSQRLYAYNLIEDAAGRLLVVGTNSDIINRLAVCRLTAAGTYDTFGSNGCQYAGTTNVSGYLVTTAPGDKIVAVGGHFQSGIGSVIDVFRFNADGSFDNSLAGFGGTSIDLPYSNNGETPSSVVVAADGSITVAGVTFLLRTLQPDSAHREGFVARLNADGTTDTTLGGVGHVTFAFDTAAFEGEDSVEDMRIRPDGRIVVLGSASPFSVPAVWLAQFSAAGVADATFGTNGRLKITPGGVESSLYQGGELIVRADGGLLLSATREGAVPFTTSVAQSIRLTAVGSFDTTYNATGFANADVGDAAAEANGVVVQSDGKIIVAGPSADVGGVVVRLTPAGAKDLAFGVGGRASVAPGFAISKGRPVALQADGKIVVAGSVLSGGFTRITVARLDAGGTLDASFGTAGLVTIVIGNGNDAGNAIAVQNDGKILVGGSASTPGGVRMALARFNADGTLDATFGSGGTVTTSNGLSSRVDAIQLLPDGRIAAAGRARSAGLNSQTAIALYTTSGALDTSFNGNGLVLIDVGYDPGEDLNFLGMGLTSGNELAIVDAGGYAQLTLSGTFSVPYGTGSIVSYYFKGTLALQADDRILVAGGTGASLSRLRFVQNNHDYSYRGGAFQFGQPGQNVFASTVQADGKFLAAGVAGGGFALTRFLGDDNQPDAFNFTALNPAPLSFGAISGPAFLTGFDAPLTLTVSGGEFCVGSEYEADPTACACNDRPYGTEPYVVYSSSGLYACVRHTTSAAFLTTTSTTLTLGSTSGTFQSTTGSAADTPNPFDFTDVTDVDPAVSVTSNAVTITGIPGGTTAVSLYGPGEYSIGCTATFITGASTIANGQTICIRLQSAAYSLGVATTTIIVGTRFADFMVTTREIDPYPDGNTYEYLTEAPRNTLVFSSPIQITGINVPLFAAFEGYGFCVSSGNNCSCDLRSFEDGSPGTTILNGQSICLRVITSPYVYSSASTGVGLYEPVTGNYITGVYLQVNTRDDIPAAISFPPLFNQPIGTLIASVPIVPTDYTVATVNVTGGEYSIGCNGAFTSATGQMTSGQSICVRHFTAATGFAQVVTTLTLGDMPGAVSATFTSTTAFGDDTPASFSFVDAADVARSAVITSAPVQILGITVPAAISVTGGSYCVSSSANCNCDVRAFGTVAATIENSRYICARHTSAAGFGLATSTTITVGGVSDTFTSTTTSAASLGFAPSPFDFGSQPVQTQGAAQAFTLANNGGTSVTITSVSAQGNFLVTSTNCVGTALAPAASCSVSAAFLPNTTGPRVGQLVATTTSPTQPTVTLTLTGTGAANDTTPDAFLFIDQYLVPVATLVTSAPVQITGLAGAAPVTVIGGLYSVSSTNSCSGDVQAFTVNPGTVVNNQYVCVRHTTSAVPGGSNDTQLIVGGVGDTFTTVTIDPVPAPFAFAPLSNVVRSTLQVSSAVVITGINTASPVTVAGGEYSIGCTGFFSQGAGNIFNGQSVCVRHLSAANANASVLTALTIGGVTGSFTSTTAALPVSGSLENDLDDDGKSDLLWKNTADGSMQGWLMNGTTATQIAGLLPAGGYSVTHTADLDGDGKADLLIRHTDGTVIGWLMNGLGVSGNANLLPAGSGWSVMKTGDLNGDGKADLIVQHTDGTVVAWIMNGLSVSSVATFVPAGSGWSVSKVADLNGDGKADLLWQHTDGTVQAWLMDGTTATQVATFVGAGSGWSVARTGDFNGDGKDDLLWQNADGSTQAWIMDGLTATSLASFTPAGTGWSPVHAGDINGDGKADLFWEHTSGASQTWLMDGTTATSLATFVPAGTGWTASHLYDLNGDGRKDVLWKHTSGAVQAWLMNGLTITQVASLAPAGTYQVTPPAP